MINMVETMVETVWVPSATRWMVNEWMDSWMELGFALYSRLPLVWLSHLGLAGNKR